MESQVIIGWLKASRSSSIGERSVEPWDSCSHSTKSSHLENVGDSALSLKSFDVGANKTWVHILHRTEGWHKVVVKELEWTPPTQNHAIKSQ